MYSLKLAGQTMVSRIEVEIALMVML